MFGFIKAAVDTVALPLDIAIDTAKMVATPSRSARGNSRTEQRVRRVEEDLDDDSSIFDIFD